MKVVFVNRFFYPDISATSQMLSDAAFYLSAQGRDIHIVASRLSYEGDVTYAELESFKGVTIHRVWTSSFGRLSLAGRFVDYLTFYVAAFFKLIWLLTPGDIVIAKTDPPLISVPVGWAARIRNAKMANWLQDLFPEVAIELGMHIPDFACSFLIRLRNRSLRQAELNFTISESMRNRVLDLGVCSDRAVVLPNWADGDVIRPIIGKNQFRVEWGLEGKFVVGYSGNLGLAHEIETLLGAIRSAAKDSTVIFLFIGGGVLLSRLQETVAREKLNNCVFKAYQPREVLALSLGLADVHLAILRPAMEGLILPSKIYGILAAARPTIYVGDTLSEVAVMLAEQKIGCAVEAGDVTALTTAINQMKNNVEQRQQAGRDARKWFEQQFDMTLTLRKMAGLLS